MDQSTFSRLFWLSERQDNKVKQSFANSNAYRVQSAIRRGDTHADTALERLLLAGFVLTAGLAFCLRLFASVHGLMTACAEQLHTALRLAGMV